MRLVSLTGSAAVSHPVHGDAEAGPDGVFDVPHEFAADLLKLRAHWRTEHDHLASLAREAVQKLQDPKHAARVLADVQSRVEALEAENAELRAKVAELAGDDTDGVDGMTVNQLRAYAAEHDIDLGNVTKKADILALVKAAPVVD